MSKKLKYENLLGGLMTSQIPYAFMIFCGFFFAKVGLLQKEGLHAFGRMNIDIFLPIFLFIQVGRSTYIYNFEQNGAIIVSFLFYFIIAFIISFVYAITSKMDLRYRYTFIFITSIVDVKRLHYLYIYSFCFLLEGKLTKEKAFCNEILACGNIHVFFQGLIIWFVVYNLIKLDKAYENQAVDVWDRIHIKNIESDDEEQKLKDSPTPLFKKVNEENNILNENTKENVMNLYKSHAISNDVGLEKNNENIKSEINNEEKKDIDNEEMIIFKGNQSFFSEINKFQSIKFFETSNSQKELLNLIFRSPFIGLILAFIVGFIRVLREWIYDTTTPVFLFFDTFNTIGSCNILLNYIIIGANLIPSMNLNKKKSYAQIRMLDYIVHLIIKVIIMPFIGVIYCYILKKKFIDDNKVLLWTCFIQWLIPSSLDVMTISQVNDANCKFVAYCIFIQLICQMIINNFIHVPTFLKAIDIL